MDEFVAVEGVRCGGGVEAVVAWRYERPARDMRWLMADGRGVDEEAEVMAVWREEIKHGGS